MITISMSFLINDLRAPECLEVTKVDDGLHLLWKIEDSFPICPDWVVVHDHGDGTQVLFFSNEAIANAE